MPGLLDHIFAHLNIDQLSRAQVLAHATYLLEINQQNLTLEQKLNYQRVKVLLDKRLIKLDHQEYQKGL